MVDGAWRALFFSRMRGLKTQLEARWQANEAKRALVAEAEALVAEGDREAADQCKAPQRRWAEIDITPRKIDRALWTTFGATATPSSTSCRRRAARPRKPPTPKPRPFANSPSR